MVAEDPLGLAAPGHDLLEFSCHAPARDRCIDDGCEALLCYVVDDVEGETEQPAHQWRNGPLNTDVGR